MREQELKLTARNGATLEDIAACDLVQALHTGTANGARRQIGRYYDTESRALEARYCALRSRIQGAGFMAAFKGRGQIVDGLSVREELECQVEGWLDHTDDLPAGALKDRVLDILEQPAPLFCTVETDIHRTTLNLESAGSEIEMVLDAGWIRGGERAHQIFEIELELKSGDIGPVMAIGRKLQERYDLVPSTHTKHQIGLGLLGLERELSHG